MAKEISNKTKAVITVLIVGIIIYFAACNASDKKVPITFDVPKLLPLTKDQLIQTLGQPVQMDTLTQAQINGGIEQTITFDKGNYELAVDLNPLDGTVIRMFLNAIDSGEIRQVTADGLDSLKSAGNLDALASSNIWWIEPQKILNSDDYTGYNIRTIKEQDKINNQNDQMNK